VQYGRYAPSGDISVNNSALLQSWIEKEILTVESVFNAHAKADRVIFTVVDKMAMKAQLETWLDVYSLGNVDLDTILI
jgi:hypothetical protein